MKTIILLLFASCLCARAQDTLRRPIAAFTPLKDDISHVSGLAIGIGQLEGNKHRQVINGLNLEINPLGLFFAPYIEGDRIENDTVYLVQNGLTISSGGFLGKVRQNGLGLSLYNVTYESNGITATLFQTYSHTLNGLHLSLFANHARECNGIMASTCWSKVNTLRGIQVGIYPHTQLMYGIQAGIANKSIKMYGLQIGLFNRSKEMKGLQVGLWNKNEKRSFPFINW